MDENFMIKQVEMTADELAQFEAFKREQARRKAEERAKEDRKAYSELVDAELDKAIPALVLISGQIKAAKEQVIGGFEEIQAMKSEVLKLGKSGQKSHTFTHSNGAKRLTIGRYVVDNWKDTIEEGIAMVKESVTNYIKDAETKALVDQIMRLLSKDKEGNLKIRQVMELDKLAAELENEQLNRGIALIKESHIANFSKTYVRAEYKDESGAWRFIPLGMTEV